MKLLVTSGTANLPLQFNAAGRFVAIVILIVFSNKNSFTLHQVRQVPGVKHLFPSAELTGTTAQLSLLNREEHLRVDNMSVISTELK